MRTIAVLRANALGDFLMTLPALHALRAAYPEAEVVLLGRRMHRDLLRGRQETVNRVIVLPPVPGLIDENPAGAAEGTRALAELREKGLDLALQLHGGGATSNPFVKSLGARWTVGLRAEGAEPLDRWVPYRRHHPEVLRYLEVAALVGAPPVTLQGRLPVLESDLRAARQIVPSSRPRVVVHPGSTDVRRRWPLERFADVAARLQHEGLEIVLIGTGREADLNHRIAQRLPRPALDCTDQLDLPGLIGLLRTSALVLGNDSGPVHLARAVGAATVVIMLAPNAITFGPLAQRRHRALIAWRLDCPICGAPTIDRRCEHDVSLVDEVPATEVLDECRSVLGEVTN